MEAIKRRTLEVTVISGENLCIDRTPATENVYVVVRAESLKCWSTKTAKQEVGSLSTSWNEKLIMEVPLHAQSITFEVQCKTPRGMDRSIGLARIAIGDVIPKEEKRSEMLSYRLRNWEGRRSGVINFSVQVVNKEQEITKKEKDSIVVNSGDFKPEISGAHRHDQDMNANNNNNNRGYVMGIPVWWNHFGIRV
ncbi:BON1-associated protein 2-like [Neltuma alba]|uniref:BON1-associated protein 2-like n=1 Tax=Neltuma alba TaxID=207710 RepID=UPI0010A43FB7|nr:BON1-associated protein 2-like [Prosopis alba]